MPITYAKSVKIGSEKVTYDEVLEENTDWGMMYSYYNEDMLVATTFDSDNDGKIDDWFRFDEDYNVLETIKDTDGNGKGDYYVEYSPDGEIINEREKKPLLQMFKEVDKKIYYGIGIGLLIIIIIIYFVKKPKKIKDDEIKFDKKEEKILEKEEKPKLKKAEKKAEKLAKKEDKKSKQEKKKKEEKHETKSLKENEQPLSDESDSIKILNQRLAKGEITKKEYNKLKKTLGKHKKKKSHFGKAIVIIIILLIIYNVVNNYDNWFNNENEPIPTTTYKRITTTSLAVVTTTTSTIPTTTHMQYVTVSGVPLEGELFFQISTDAFNYVKKETQLVGTYYIIDYSEICSDNLRIYPMTRLRYESDTMRKYIDLGDFCITGEIDAGLD